MGIDRKDINEGDLDLVWVTTDDFGELIKVGSDSLDFSNPTEVVTWLCKIQPVSNDAELRGYLEPVIQRLKHLGYGKKRPPNPAWVSRINRSNLKKIIDLILYQFVQNGGVLPVYEMFVIRSLADRDDLEDLLSRG